MANSIRLLLKGLHLLVAVSLAMLFVPANASAQDYDGQDANAPWRTTAAQQIDLLRKADINLQVQLADGTPVLGAQVQATMQRHEFKFGSAVDPRYFLTSQPSFFNQNYADRIDELFNTATLENHLKWKLWSEGNPSNSPPVTQEGLDYLNARDIAVRGHNLMWPGLTHVPSFVSSILQLPNPTNADKQNLYDLTFAHINDIAPAVAGKVFAWDALNEPRGNHAIEDLLVGFTPAGESTILDVADMRARWFSAAKLADPGAAMFINEFQNLPGNTLANAEVKRATYKAQIADIIAAGGNVEGIGFESHFDDVNPNKQITGIPKLLSVLDDFQNQFNLPAHVTEYDFATTDQTLQAEYTRDFMTAVFSHSSIEAFETWGFWEGKMANPTGAFYDQNWNIKPNGQAYKDLVLGDWWTDSNGNTDSQGDYGLRGFKGDYQIAVDYQGQQLVFDKVVSDGGLNFTVVVGGGSTNFLGGDVLTATDWDNGLPDSAANSGTIATSGIASNKVSGFFVTQTGGTIDFTHSQSFRSSLVDGTQWHLQGGVLTDNNSNVRIDDATLFVEGGAFVLDSTRVVSLGKGTARIEVTSGSLTAKNVQFGNIGAGTTAGSKILEMGIGDGVVELLTSGAPFFFGDDGDPENDYVNFLTGTEGTLITTEDVNYFEQLWDDGNLRIDDLTGIILGLTFDQTLFSLTDNGNGTTTLALLQLLIPGDFNGDGFVNEVDLSLWEGAFGVDNGGDADDDGDSDGADFLAWQRNFTGGSGLAASTKAVPEPSSVGLLAIAMSCFCLMRHRELQGIERREL